MTDLKFCVDCRHFLGSPRLPLRECTKIFTNDLVTGSLIFPKAATMRESEDACGEDAKWFVLKEVGKPKPEPIVSAEPVVAAKRSLWQRFKDDMLPATGK